jgi:hypothetical protein
MANSVDSNQAGKQAFCAGIDLKQRLNITKPRKWRSNSRKAGFQKCQMALERSPSSLHATGATGMLTVRLHSPLPSNQLFNNLPSI